MKTDTTPEETPSNMIAPVKLDDPITVNGRTISEIRLRRPKVKDLKRMEKAKGGNFSKTIQLFCDLCEEGPEVFDEMTPLDFDKLEKAIAPFLPQPEPTGEA